MNLIIDVGNTRVKTAVFESDAIVAQHVFQKDAILTEVKKIVSTHKITKAIIATVAALSKEKITELHQFLKLTELKNTTKVPFLNTYKTPKTLGVDRIALASAAVNEFPGKHVLVIDAGTCITYDIINNKREYLGGAIAPGILMRFKALHDYTANLPLLEKRNLEAYIGTNTETSIQSGVVNGVVQEINGIVKQYQEDFPNLTVVLTGGDTNFLSKRLKSGIFASQNFLLKGLNHILNFNDS